MKIVPRNAAQVMASRTIGTDKQVERAWSRLAPPIEAARVLEAELKPASAKADISKRRAPNYQRGSI